MDIRLFGQIEAIDRHSLAVGGPTQRRVLALLALRRNEVVPVARLVDALWPDGDVPDHGEHNVRTYVHRLRVALDDHGDRVETVGAGYRLALDADELDVARFERLAATAVRLAETGELMAALDHMEEAERLWRGEPLVEFEHESWAVPDVVRLSELRLALRTRRASVQLELGRASDAVLALEPLVREEPMREEPRALLMRALYESGRQVEALRLFSDYRRSLIDEFGVPPSDDLVELDRAIARGDLPPAASGDRTIHGFSLAERIGEGAFAIVYRATQTSLGRDVAVKIIRAELANEPEFIRRFEAEAQMVARVEHPNVVPLYDYWREPDRACLVMRWMTGRSLAARLGGEGWSFDRTIPVVEQVAAGLDAAHRAGVVHGDVKPENILFDGEDRAYLGDFGIAHDAATARMAVDEPATYAAPEQLRGRSAGPEADVYALAIVARTMLIGRSESPALPERVADVLGVATSTDPSQRHPTATGMAAALRAAVSSNGAALSVAASGERVNPYKGLRAFEESDAVDFHGRDRLVAEMLEHLRSPDARLLVVVGPSGSGKSSVVRAGLVPALRAGGVRGSSQWFITTVLPGARPFEALEAALLRVAVDPPAALLAQLRDGERGVVRAIRRILPDDHAVLTIVIDQFEELFHDEVADEDRDLFLRALAVAADARESPARIVLTMRADYYDRPLRHAEFAPLLRQHTVTVPPLTPDELHDAIVRPAAAVGVEIDPALASVIVADVGRQPGGLPLLQYALTQMFDRTEGQRIDLDSYASIGGLTGALGRHAEQLWVESDADTQAATRRTLGRLVHVGDGPNSTRRRVPLAKLGYDEPATRAAIDRYATARLLTFDHDASTREPTVEIAHEALLDEWPRLRRWLDDDRDALRAHRHLGDAATEWIQSGRDPNDLYRGARLEAAEALSSSRAVALNAAELEFVSASVHRRTEEDAARRRRLRRLRRLVAMTAIVALIAAVAGALAYRNQQHAEQVARDAETARLVATAESLAPTNPREAMLIAVAAHQREQSPATLGALHAALAHANPVIGYLGWGAEYLGAASMSSGVVGARADGLDLFDRESAEVVDTVDLDIGRGPYPESSARYRVAGHRDRLAVAVGSSVHVFDVDDALEPLFERPMPDAVVAVDVSADGGLVVASATDGTIAAWTASGEEAFAPLQLSLHDDVAEQYEAHVDQPFAFDAGNMRDFFGSIPVWVVPVVHDDHIHLHAGATAVTVDHGGNVLGEPVYTLIDLGDAGGLPGVTRSVLHPEPGATMVAGTFSIGQLPPPGDPSTTAAVALAESTFGPGDRPVIGTVLGADRRPISLIDDGSLVWFDPDTGERSATLELGVGSARSMVTGRDPGTVLVATERGLAIVSLDRATPLSRSVERAPEQTQLSISHNGRFVVLGGSAVFPVPVTVYARSDDGATYRSLADFPVSTAVWAAAPPGHAEAGMEPLAIWGAIVGDEVSSYLFQLDTPDAPSLVSSAHIDGLTAGDVDPRGRWTVADSVATQRVHVYDLVSGDVVTSFPLPEAGEDLTGLRFHPSGDRLLVSSQSGRSQLYDTETWDRRDEAALAAHDIAVGYWNADGSLVATASSDGQIAIRDGDTFETIRHMAGPVATFNLGTGGPLIFSHDDSLLLTDHDNVARLWDVATGVQVGIDMTTADGTNSNVNTGGTLQLITGADGAALIWNLDTESWADVACRAAGSNLSHAEWDQWGPRDEGHRPICDRYPVAR